MEDTDIEILDNKTQNIPECVMDNRTEELYGNPKASKMDTDSEINGKEQNWWKDENIRMHG